MNIEQKQINFEYLRSEYVAFMQKLAKLPGSPIQKQQAFLRMDEGHMWMQNAIMTYVEPPKPDAAQEPAPEATANEEKAAPAT